jgi:hypothetical protein
MMKDLKRQIFWGVMLLLYTFLFRGTPYLAGGVFVFIIFFGATFFQDGDQEE